MNFVTRFRNPKSEEDISFYIAELGSQDSLDSEGVRRVLYFFINRSVQTRIGPTMQGAVLWEPEAKAKIKELRESSFWDEMETPFRSYAHMGEKKMPEKQDDTYIDTVLPVQGIWSAGDSKTIRIMVLDDNYLNVSMSAYRRPKAHGSILNASTITVTFPDDQTYTGTLQPPDKIRWSNGTVWRRMYDVEG